MDSKWTTVIKAKANIMTAMYCRCNTKRRAGYPMVMVVRDWSSINNPNSDISVPQLKLGCSSSFQQYTWSSGGAFMLVLLLAL